MSALDALLNPVYSEIKKEVCVGPRFIDPETKEPVRFTMRALTQEERSAIRKRCIVTRDADGSKYNEVDNDLFLARCIVESCVEPDMKSVEFCTFRNADGRNVTVAPDTALKKRLLAKEYERLAKAFMDLNMMDDADPAESEVTKN